jgi:glucose/arabinose dehydrogenase
MKSRPQYGWALAWLLLPASFAALAAPPVISGCELFSKKNYWNTPVDTLQVHPSSATWVTSIGSATATHPDFGSVFGIPFTTAPGTQPRVQITFDPEAADESDPGPYPIPPNAPVEDGSDSHVLVVDRDNCVLYELFAAAKNPDNSWDAYSGAIWDFKLNANRPQTWTSADAAGLPILPGLLRYDEFIAGNINHAIRFTASQTLNQFIWPATHQAGGSTATRPPMGARFRLKASFDISTYSPQIQVVLRAMKKYGIVLADNGSNWYFSGEINPAWDDNVLDALKTMHGSDFEAVDTAPMMISTSSTEAFTPPPAITLREVASGLNQPLDIQNANDASGRLFIVEKAGAIKILRNGSVLATPFFSRTVDTVSERGLLGLAFDPKFTANRRFFVYYVPNDGTGDLHVSSYTTQLGSPDLADMASEQAIITIAHPGQSNHNGGKLAFGPDGFLYISIGDGGGGGDTPNNAQNRNILLGKLLRLDVSAGGPGYAIPPDNPFVGVAGTRAEIWAYGLRNPFRFSFDRSTGDLYIGDVGQDTTEEIDYQPAGIAGGRNYGWHVFEGPNCFNPPTGCSLANHTLPILSYGHDVGNVVTGGNVYRGRKSRALNGYYIYADEGSNRMWGATRDGTAWGTFQLVTSATPASPGLANPAAFGEDEAGELYVASIGNGRVFAIDGPGPGVPERVVDLNGNGNDDLVWTNADGRAAVWLMSGLAPTNTAEILGPGTGWSPTHLADFDGDGKTDILWRHTDGRVAIYLMNGTLPATTTQIMNAGSGWSVVGTGDLNADGKADLVWQHADGRVAVWLMNGTTAVATQEILAAGTGFTVTRVADFDADGKRDILFSHPDGRVAIWLMNGTAVKATGQILNAGTGWSVVHTPDLNGDGKADIVWQNADGSTAVWLMNGTTFVSGAGLLGPGTGWSVARTGDFDADGKTDLLWSHTDGRVAIWLMNGITPGTQTQILNAASGWSVRRLADFNGDGTSDILWQHTDGRVAMWLMNGTAVASGAGILGTGTGWSVTGVSQ